MAAVWSSWWVVDVLRRLTLRRDGTRDEEEKERVGGGLIDT